MHIDDVAQLFAASRTQKALRAVGKVARSCNAQFGGHFDQKIVHLWPQLERTERRRVAAPSLNTVPPSTTWCIAGNSPEAIRVLTGLRLAAR
jgi:hypothetical protein